MATVLIISAARGIGRDLVQACLERGDRSGFVRYDSHRWEDW